MVVDGPLKITPDFLSHEDLGPGNFENVYAAWPERAYVFWNPKGIAYISHPHVEGSIDWELEIPVWVDNNWKEIVKVVEEEKVQKQ